MKAIAFINKWVLLVTLLLLFFPFVSTASILNVQEKIQEQNQWCWAGVSQAVLEYYGKNIEQCTIANFAWEDTSCCSSPDSSTCNQPNSMYSRSGSIEAILENWGVDSNGQNSVLSKETIETEIGSSRPFVMRFGWTTDGGHFLVGRGIEGDNVYYMDPWPGNGYTISTYDWVVSSSNHTWTHTLKITSTLTKVNLKANNGQYLCAEGGGGDLIYANRDSVGAWETFELIELGNNKVALRANNGQYLCAEGGGGDLIYANRDSVGGWETFVKNADELSGSVDLTTPTPIEDGIDFSYSGAAYDWYYKNHWRITILNGYMIFSFSGKKNFSFHALGSTSSGVSYCYVDIYVNGSLYESDKFINKNWTWYDILSSEFNSGSNTVKIVLVGNTHFWIDQAKTEEEDNTIAGTWNVTETYDCCGDFPASWVITKTGTNLTLVATRTSTSSTVNGTGTVSGNTVTISHPMYDGDDCEYSFTGTVSNDSNTMSGDVTYSCSDGYNAPGTWTATKQGTIASSIMIEMSPTTDFNNNPDPFNAQ